MKLKQFLSTALALVMVFSLSIPVLAADYSTSVSYDGTGTERYVLTVPSQLKPGTSGNVTLSGTWASNRHITVTADKTVAMTGSLGGSEALDITFAGIDLAGDNEAAVSETKSVSVASLDALFGNWTGVFYYNVGAADVDPLEGLDLSQAVEFTITQYTRATVGYTGEENENLVIPAYFVGTTGRVNKVTSIADGASEYRGAFSECKKLTSVTIPETVTSIGAYAFNHCSSLTSVIISNGVVSIGRAAFADTSLNSVTIPDSVTSIVDRAFSDCFELTSINVNAGNSNYSSDAGILFNKDKTALIRYPIAKGETTYTIPNSVKKIENRAFSGCRSFTSVTIPASVTNIGKCAFYGCSNLTSLIYSGTQAQWWSITKGSSWDEITDDYTIYCTDGNISKTS